MLSTVKFLANSAFRYLYSGHACGFTRRCTTSTGKDSFSKVYTLFNEGFPMVETWTLCTNPSSQNHPHHSVLLKGRPFRQRMLPQHSHHLFQFLITPLLLISSAHHSIHLFQTQYLSSRLSCRRQEKIRSLSTVRHSLRIDRALHTGGIYASFKSKRWLFFSLRILQQYETALGKYRQTFFSVNVTFSLVSIPLLSGSRRKSIAQLSTLTRFFRLAREDEWDIAVSSDRASDGVDSYRDTFFFTPASLLLFSSFHFCPKKHLPKPLRVQLNTIFVSRPKSSKPHGSDTPQPRYIWERMLSCQKKLVLVRKITLAFYRHERSKNFPLFSTPILVLELFVLSFCRTLPEYVEPS